jgi:biotin carboxylase
MSPVQPEAQAAFKEFRSELPTVLVVSTGFHLYREYLMQQMVAHANLWLLLDAEPTWQAPYITGFTLTDTLDADRMIESSRALAGTISIDGVICWDEIRMVPTAKLAQALGLPGGDPEAFANCRDKHLTRRALAVMSVPQPRSELVANVDEALAVAGSIGYPVIVKPRALGGSYGVTLVNDAAELRTAMDLVRKQCELLASSGYALFDKIALIEEYLHGPEVSVDVAWVDGRMFPLFVGRKETGFFPYFEEIGHVVEANDPLLRDTRFLAVVRSAHEAVGFRNGITHTELMLTADGPKIIEINSRLGGDMIPFIGGIASGISAGATAVAVATGRAPDIAKTRERFAAVRFLYPSSDCVVTEIALDGVALPAEVDVACLLVNVGQTLYFPRVSGRYAFVVAHGASAKACHATLAAAERAIHFAARPLAEAVATA